MATGGDTIVSGCSQEEAKERREFALARSPTPIQLLPPSKTKTQKKQSERRGPRADLRRARPAARGRPRRRRRRQCAAGHDVSFENELWFFLSPPPSGGTETKNNDLDSFLRSRLFSLPPGASSSLSPPTPLPNRSLNINHLSQGLQHRVPPRRRLPGQVSRPGLGLRRLPPGHRRRRPRRLPRVPRRHPSRRRLERRRHRRLAAPRRIPAHRLGRAAARAGRAQVPKPARGRRPRRPRAGRHGDAVRVRARRAGRGRQDGAAGDAAGAARGRGVPFQGRGLKEGGKSVLLAGVFFCFCGRFFLTKKMKFCTKKKKVFFSLSLSLSSSLSSWLLSSSLSGKDGRVLLFRGSYSCFYFSLKEEEKRRNFCTKKKEKTA